MGEKKREQFMSVLCWVSYLFVYCFFIGVNSTRAGESGAICSVSGLLGMASCAEGCVNVGFHARKKAPPESNAIDFLENAAGDIRIVARCGQTITVSSTVSKIKNLSVNTSVAPLSDAIHFKLLQSEAVIKSAQLKCCPDHVLGEYHHPYLVSDEPFFIILSASDTVDSKKIQQKFQGWFPAWLTSSFYWQQITGNYIKSGDPADQPLMLYLHFNEHDPIPLELMPDDCLQLIKNIQSTSQLLNWVAPFLYNREEFFLPLLDIIPKLCDEDKISDSDAQGIIYDLVSDLITSHVKEFELNLDVFLRNPESTLAENHEYIDAISVDFDKRQDFKVEASVIESLKPLLAYVVGDGNACLFSEFLGCSSGKDDLCFNAVWEYWQKNKLLSLGSLLKSLTIIGKITLAKRIIEGLSLSEIEKKDLTLFVDDPYFKEIPSYCLRNDRISDDILMLLDAPENHGQVLVNNIEDTGTSFESNTCFMSENKRAGNFPSRMKAVDAADNSRDAADNRCPPSGYSCAEIEQRIMQREQEADRTALKQVEQSQVDKIHILMKQGRTEKAELTFRMEYYKTDILSQSETMKVMSDKLLSFCPSPDFEIFPTVSLLTALAWASDINPLSLLEDLVDSLSNMLIFEANTLLPILKEIEQRPEANASPFFSQYYRGRFRLNTESVIRQLISKVTSKQKKFSQDEVAHYLSGIIWKDENELLNAMATAGYLGLPLVIMLPAKSNPYSGIDSITGFIADERMNIISDITAEKLKSFVDSLEVLPLVVFRVNNQWLAGRGRTRSAYSRISEVCSTLQQVPDLSGYYIHSPKPVIQYADGRLVFTHGFESKGVIEPCPQLTVNQYQFYLFANAIHISQRERYDIDALLDKAGKKNQIGHVLADHAASSALALRHLDPLAVMKVDADSAGHILNQAEDHYLRARGLPGSSSARVDYASDAPKHLTCERPDMSFAGMLRKTLSELEGDSPDIHKICNSLKSIRSMYEAILLSDGFINDALAEDVELLYQQVYNHPLIRFVRMKVVSWSDILIGFRCLDQINAWQQERKFTPIACHEKLKQLNDRLMKVTATPEMLTSQQDYRVFLDMISCALPDLQVSQFHSLTAQVQGVLLPAEKKTAAIANASGCTVYG